MMSLSLTADLHLTQNGGFSPASVAPPRFKTKKRRENKKNVKNVNNKKLIRD